MLLKVYPDNKDPRFGLPERGLAVIHFFCQIPKELSRGHRESSVISYALSLTEAPVQTAVCPDHCHLSSSNSDS